MVYNGKIFAALTIFRLVIDGTIEEVNEALMDFDECVANTYRCHMTSIVTDWLPQDLGAE